MLVFIKCTTIFRIYLFHPRDAEVFKYIEIPKESTSISLDIRLLNILLRKSSEGQATTNIWGSESRAVKLIFLLLVSGDHFLDVVRICAFVVW